MKPLSSQITKEHFLIFTAQAGFVCPPRAITVRVPVPEAGVVDIPIIEKEAQGQQHHHKVGG